MLAIVAFVTSTPVPALAGAAVGFAVLLVFGLVLAFRRPDVH